MVPKKGLEPLRSRERQILSLVRLPFRHFGKSLLNYFKNEKNQAAKLTFIKNNLE